MFDMDDLTEETLCILCKEFGSKLKMFVWRGFEVHGGEGVSKNYFYFNRLSKNISIKY